MFPALCYPINHKFILTRSILMKYTIEGLQQQKLVELNCDCTDAVILRYLIDFDNTKQMKKFTLEGKNYFWIHYKTVIKELPIINIKKQALADRLKKMCSNNIFEFYLEKTDQGTFTYYRFIEDTLEALLSTPMSTELRTGVVVDYERVSSELRAKDSSTIYSSTNDSNIIINNNISDLENHSLHNLNISSRELIEKWNSYKEFTKHKITNNKTIQTIDKLLKVIKTGYAYQFVKIDPTFAKKNNIPMDILHKKFTDEEIIAIFDKHALSFQLDKWPIDKKHLPKSLLTFLFNPQRCTSFFFMLACNDPKPLKSPDVLCDEKALKIYKKISSISHDDKTISSLKHVVNSVIVEYRKIINTIGIYLKNHAGFTSIMGSLDDPYPFLEEHAEWLEETYGDILTTGHLKPHTKSWERFIHHIEQVHDFNLSLSEKNITELKEEYDRNMKKIQREKEKKKKPVYEYYGIDIPEDMT